MDPQLFELVFSAVLSGTVEALAGKALDGAAGKLAERFRSGVDGQPVEEAAQAVRRAVEAAREDLVDDYWAGEDEHSRDVVALLQHPPFAEEVTRRVLFQGQPDFGRLRQFYLTQEGEETASERWEALEPELKLFFSAIERHLTIDPDLGEVVRHSQDLAKLDKLEDNTGIIAAASREVQRLEAQVAASTEKTASGVGLLVEVAGRQEAHLGEMTALLRQAVEKLGGTPAEVVSASHLTTGEIEYLRLLRKECDQLPLAEDRRGGKKKEGRKRASLANVYVDLETTQRPGLESVFERLGVPDGERKRLHQELSHFGGRELAKAGGVGAEETGEALELVARPGREGEDHPLKPWLPEGMSLEEAQSPLTALEALALHRHLVLLGDPGSGKSTLVNHLAATLAGGLTGDEREWAKVLEDRFAEPLFPLRVVLRRWSAGLEPGEEVTIDRVRQALSDQAEGLDLERLLARLHDPHTLVLFDGLDEVPAGPGGDETALDRRRWVLEAVEKFLTAHKDCRVLITSRVKPYREGDYQLPGLPAVELAPLDRPRIERFCHLWYEEADRLRNLRRGVSAADCEKQLVEAIRGRQVLGEMAETPLLLTMLAGVNAYSELPEGRAELYDKCIEQLLWEWEKEKAEESGTRSLAALLEEPRPQLQRSDIERVFWQLTYQAHGKSGKSTVTLPAADLREALAGVHPAADEADGWAWAARVVSLMKQRSGLVVADGVGGFTFPHRSFQEYLAARWLLEQGNAALAVRELAEDDSWREVVLLACGFLRWHGSYTDVQGIVAELVAGDPPTDPAGWRRVGLAGQAWLEFGPHRARGEVGKELAKKIPDLLTTLMQHSKLPAAQRLEAGLLLADLGVLPDDLDARVEIPADKLPYSFEIGKYPVSNAQYRRFVEAGAYEEGKPWWSDEAKEEIERWEGGKWPEGPRYWGDRNRNRSTQPVVGVSWYEAAAYCVWLTEDLRAKGKFGDDQEVRLAREEEWARAAGGPEGTKYPWGNKFDPSRANTKESSLGQPTPVSMYPGGASPEGVFDLAGNVWEWIAEKGRLAGGAYYRDPEGVGASARYVIPPRVRLVSIGFRCVVVPVSRAQS